MHVVNKRYPSDTKNHNEEYQLDCMAPGFKKKKVTVLLFYVFFLFIFFFETMSHIAQVGLEVTMWPWMTLNS